MATMTMSLPALYNYALNTSQVDIFSGLSVPALLDRSTLIDLLLLRSAPFESVYTDSDYLQAAITNWSAVHQRTFTKWAEALNIDYEPLNNYDRTEESTDTGLESKLTKKSEKGHDTESESNDTESVRKGLQNSATIGSTKDNTDSDSTVTDSVSAEDVNTWSNANKSVTGSGTSSGASNMQSINGNDSDETSTQTDRVSDRTNKLTGDESENVVDSRNHRLRAYGNIGVTTSQQMLQAELDVSAWNIYEHIADLFLDEFCVLLY